MPYTHAQYETLKSACATGLLEVRYADGRTVKYRSLDDMEALLRKMEGELGIRPRRSNVGYAVFRRG